MPKERDKSRCDAVIARVAARQHGVITTGQLLNAGVLASGITDRTTAGRLHRIHRGVYSVGHGRLSDQGRWMAAVLACGKWAVLSHLSAAELWGIRRRVRRLSEAGERGRHGSVHVTVAKTSGMRRRSGILLHRSSTLIAAHCTRRDGIPVTTPSRTLADLRPLLSPAEFGQALREAEFLRLPITDRFESEGDRTELESAFLALCRRHRLSRPEVNVEVDRFVVDFLWRQRRLIAEVDGWASHRTRSAFEEDRARDARLAVLGFRVVRVTWRQVRNDTAGVAETIRAILRSPA
jgi:very-short-patch-repair endonuclease